MRNFIDENKLTFEKGMRNSTITTIIGFAQHKGLKKEELKAELKAEIEQDSFIKEEIDRLWNYCENKGYKNYWKSEEAKQRYTFI